MKKLTMIALASQALAGDLTAGTGVAVDILSINQTFTVGYSDEFDINMPADLHISADAVFHPYSGLLVQGYIGPSIPITSSWSITAGPAILFSVESDRIAIGRHLQIKNKIDENTGFIGTLFEGSYECESSESLGGWSSIIGSQIPDTMTLSIKAYKTL